MLYHFLGCESTFDNDTSNDLPFIAGFSISPEEINFDSLTTEIIDTTINIRISGEVKNISENTRVKFSVTDVQNDVQVEEGNMDLTLLSPLNGSFEKT